MFGKMRDVLIKDYINMLKNPNDILGHIKKTFTCFTLFLNFLLYFYISYFIFYHIFLIPKADVYCYTFQMNHHSIFDQGLEQPDRCGSKKKLFFLSDSFETGRGKNRQLEVWKPPIQKSRECAVKFRLHTTHPPDFWYDKSGLCVGKDTLIFCNFFFGKMTISPPTQNPRI